MIGKETEYKLSRSINWYWFIDGIEGRISTEGLSEKDYSRISKSVNDYLAMRIIWDSPTNDPKENILKNLLIIPLGMAVVFLDKERLIELYLRAQLEDLCDIAADDRPGMEPRRKAAIEGMRYFVQEDPKIQLPLDIKKAFGEMNARIVNQFQSRYVQIPQEDQLSPLNSNPELNLN